MKKLVCLIVVAVCLCGCGRDAEPAPAQHASPTQLETDMKTLERMAEAMADPEKAFAEAKKRAEAVAAEAAETRRQIEEMDRAAGAQNE